MISHAHGDHDQGAALLQSRCGAKMVMGAADRDSTLQRSATGAGGVPKRDVAVGPEGQKITWAIPRWEVIATPGHTPGALSYIFPVKDGGRILTVAYSGGTAFNFPRQAQAFAVYRDSQRKIAEAARGGREASCESDASTVQRYFDMTGNCAEAQPCWARRGASNEIAARRGGCMYSGKLAPLDSQHLPAAVAGRVRRRTTYDRIAVEARDRVSVGSVAGKLRRRAGADPRSQ